MDLVIQPAMRMSFCRLPLEYARTFFDGSNSEPIGTKRSRYATST